MKVTKNKKPDQPRKRLVKYPGIMEDARKLGINRTYLWLCLEGRATSAPVLRRYAELKASQNGGAA
jgi:hypothetical protein